MSVTQPLGFLAAGATAGIKPSGKPDVCLIARDRAHSASAPGAGSAMVFTRNVVVGAPVIVGRALREATLAGRTPPLSAILINAGNSNSATGEQGVADARTCMAAAARELSIMPEQVLPVSTGVIGRPLPVAKITGAVPNLARALARGEAADAAAAAAIMTTDLVPKRAAERVTIDGRTVTIAAIAKGSGMIAPALDCAAGQPAPSGTMLAFITTDAAIGSRDLQAALEFASPRSFDRLSVDNHPSCSDTAVVLSSGAAGGSPIIKSSPAFTAFTSALLRVCTSLAEQIVADGEGATRVFHVTVRGARTDADAEMMARAIVNSPLVKCAIHGQDPNWGRIVTAAGIPGIPFDTAEASLLIGPVEVYRAGVPIMAALDDPQLRTAMSAKRVPFILTVGRGKGEAWMLGCDLSKDYVSINADYTT